MKRTQPHIPSFSILLLLILGLNTSCTHSERAAAMASFTPSYKPTNSYNSPVNESSTAPKETVIRVVALPLYYSSDIGSFLNRIDTAIKSEFTKTNLFEVISIDRNDLEDLFELLQVSSSEPLPDNFIDKLKEHYAADGVLFTELTYYAPYRPMALGLRAQLVSLQSRQILWAFDDIFDAGNPQVAAAAQRFQKSHLKSPYPLDNSENILQSPARFSRYVANSAFNTILSN